ncbi:hypothetical protein F5Y15DRAFT_411177 [Xylariaceae sp. FL0016]|nr:hypothetical protein F5Y15DRAFT_411177 [Xylariaceae sp. FL0016]
MNKAKDQIKDFMSKKGHHDTTVHKTEAPAVQHETVKPTQHEEVNTAIDREVHQDHYHHTTQPVMDNEVLPEQHHHKLGGVQHREFDRRDNDATKRALAEENARFFDTKDRTDTTHTQSMAPTQQGEHVHHHIHETVHPEIHKETVEPHVVHSTVPIHETHHNPAQHHSGSALPAVSMQDYKKVGGVLGGKKEMFDKFEGQPQERGGIMSTALGTGPARATGPNATKGARHGDFDPLDEGVAGQYSESKMKDAKMMGSDTRGMESQTHGTEQQGWMDKLNPMR